MAMARRLVSLDVHATKVVAAVLDAETGELRWFRIGGDVGEAAGLCAGLPRPVRGAYEAGPTGYGLARELERRGMGCVVAAPSKTPRASGDRVKTDRRDAELLVRLLLAASCIQSGCRDPRRRRCATSCARARGGPAAPMRCRHRLSKLLLRHGIRFDDGRAWTDRHRAWLAGIELGRPAAQATLADACGAVDALVHRREQLEREIVALLPSSPWQVQVGRLRCLRGIDTLSAAGLCAEIGDFDQGRAGRHFGGTASSRRTSSARVSKWRSRVAHGGSSSSRQPIPRISSLAPRVGETGVPAKRHAGFLQIALKNPSTCKKLSPFRGPDHDFDGLDGMVATRIRSGAGGRRCLLLALGLVTFLAPQARAGAEGGRGRGGR